MQRTPTVTQTAGVLLLFQTGGKENDKNIEFTGY